MHKYRKLVCFCLLLCTFLCMSLPVLADEMPQDYNIDVPFTLEDFDSFDEYTEAINMYLNPEDYIAPLGTVDSGELGTENVTVRLYAGPYADWYIEQNFSSSADLAYTKTFAVSSIKSNLQNVSASTARKPATFLNSYFKPLFGYTCTFNLKEGETVNGGTVDFELDFSGDTAYAVSNAACQATWSSSSFSDVKSVIPTTNWPNITNLFGSMTSLIGKGGYSYLSTSSGNSVFVGAMHNELSFIGMTSDGKAVDLSFYTDTTGGKYRVKLPSDTEFTAFVFDMEYYYTDSSSFVSPGSNYTNYYFPYMFKANFSGSITFDQNSMISGLISSIIQWLKQILNAILSLPQKIADLVIDGIKSLFLPSAEDLSGVFETATGKLEERLGFIYQITTWLFDLFNSFLVSINPQEYITVPKLSIPWTNMPDWASVSGNELVIWQEFQFKVIPEGAESLQTIVKTMTSLWAVLSLIACCVDSYHDFVGESPVYRNSPERMEQKKAAQNFAGEQIRRRRR